MVTYITGIMPWYLGGGFFNGWPVLGDLPLYLCFMTHSLAYFLMYVLRMRTMYLSVSF